MADLNSGRVVRMALGGGHKKQELLRRILSENGSGALMSVDQNGVLTAYLEDAEAVLDLMSSLYASGVYPENALELGFPAEGTHYAS